MRELKIAYGSSCFAKVWSNKTITFDALCERLKNTIRTPETVEEYPKLSKAERDRAKDKGGMVGGWLKQGRRKAANVECRSMLTHDIDSVDPDFLERYRMLNQYASCLYSTHSHTPEAPRYRIITPLTRDVSPEEYLALTRLLAKEWGIDCVDSCSYRAHQLMYWPTTPSNGEYVFERFDGAWLNPDAFLSAHPGWRDVSLLPTSSRESTLIDRQRKQQADPLAKPGIVGAFCRTYSIEEAIDTFLSDVYQPSAMTGRYDYVPADSSAGVVLYDGKFAYSHHATDPACGKLLNAFDLVRIHKFRDLDDKVAADTAPSKLPSYKAMCDFAVQDAGVKKTLAEDRAAQAQEDFKADDNWQAQLDLERNGTIKDTMANISAILRYDPNLQGIVYNQFSNLLDVREALPWQQVKPGWSDTDLACAKLYFERCYGIWSPTKFKDALLAVTSAERLYHPVRDYLESLVWDGMPRLDTLLIDYLGADDTPYVRAATRKTLTAGVARIYEPGVKFDSILVLNGPQGIGKSTFFARLGKKWYSDSLTIADMKDKTAPEKLQGYWLLEISELAGMKKMDVETVKSFITRTDDKYRQSYGVSVESHPRSCIIVGTTNSDGGFLRDITGNRRFWPVRVSGGGKLHSWDMKDIDQIWAEAVYAYRNGEELFLKDDVAAEAYAQQREAMESDDREGVVQDYLDRLLPADWDKYDLYQRRSYFGGSDFGTPAEGTVRRDRVCAMLATRALLALRVLRSPLLLPDAKAQVTYDYEAGRIDTFLISTQHRADVHTVQVKEIVSGIMVQVAEAYGLNTDFRALVNPTGRFVQGGSFADTGVTGRKIIADTYGGMCRHGGGAFSGKDPSKVDRSAAYMARKIARDFVLAGYAKRCEIQLAYAIGMKEPVSVNVNCFGTETVAEKELAQLAQRQYDLTPAGIIKALHLKAVDYNKTAAYGHFGKPQFPWEQ